jgi:hypothetical protein
LLCAPPALEKAENGHDLVVAQLIAKARHTRCRFIAATLANNRQQQRVGVMPRVAVTIMWGRWDGAIS